MTYITKEQENVLEKRLKPCPHLRNYMFKFAKDGNYHRKVDNFALMHTGDYDRIMSHLDVYTAYGKDIDW